MMSYPERKTFKLIYIGSVYVNVNVLMFMFRLTERSKQLKQII